jgi:hypothetical protein
MRFTTVPRLTAGPAGRRARVGYHYVVPAGATNRWRAAARLNEWVERTPLRRAALNVSLVIEC